MYLRMVLVDWLTPNLTRSSSLILSSPQDGLSQLIRIMNSM